MKILIRCHVHPQKPERHCRECETALDVATRGRRRHQGPVVRVALQLQSGEQAAALLPDDAYFAAPVQPGDPAALVWAEADAHPVAMS